MYNYKLNNVDMVTASQLPRAVGCIVLHRESQKENNLRTTLTAVRCYCGGP